MAQHPGSHLAGAPPQQVQVATGAPPQGGDQQLILQALEQALTQSIDQEGYVDVAKLQQIWPQVAQQLGLNIPFETVLQMLQQNPEMIEEMVQRIGAIGIRLPDGRTLTGEQLAGIGTGATGGA